MPTAEEARAELARRELARRAAARVASEGGTLAEQGWAATRAYQDVSPPRPAARPAPRPVPPRRGQARSGVTEATQALATLNSGIPGFDEISAGLDSARRLVSGEASDIGDAWSQSRAQQDAWTQDFATRRPNAAPFIRSSGTAGSTLVPVSRLAGLPAAAAVPQASRLGNAARGATTAAAQGAVYGFTDRGTLEERAQAARESGAWGAFLGGILGGAMPAKPSARRPAPRGKPSDAQVLRDAGVKLTPGQRRGGANKIYEDLAARAPIVGPAIRSARTRAGESFNRAAVNRALAPLGETLPPSVKTGPDAIAYASRRLGQEFEAAYARAPQVAADQGFMSGMAQIAPRISELTPSNKTVLEGILRQRLDRLSGPITGEQAGRIRTEIASIARGYQKSGDPNQQALGSILRDVGDELDSLIIRSDPTGEVGPMLERAREGWGSFAVVRRAGAAANTGTFSPAQLSAAVRAQDSSVAKGAVARGEARMQDLSAAASRLMPDGFGNPGTADATGVRDLGVLWGGSLLSQNPVAIGGMATATGGLTAAAIPYWMHARNIAAQVPRNATPAQAQGAIQQLEAMMAKHPELAQAIGQLRDQVARQAGAAAATTSQPPSPR